MYITLNIIEIFIIAAVAWFGGRAILNSTKDSFIKEALLFERLRTFLYMSHYSKRPISVLMMKPKQYINEAVVKSGVVTNIRNGSEGKEWHKRYIGGNFSLGIKDGQGQETFFDFADIYAISPTVQESKQAFLDSKNTVNLGQHLRPFTGIWDSSDSNETYCYRVLSYFSHR